MSDFFTQLTSVFMYAIFLSVSLFTYLYVYRRLEPRERREAVRGGAECCAPPEGKLKRRRPAPSAAEAKRVNESAARQDGRDAE